MVAADAEQVDANGGGGGFPLPSLGRQSSIYSLTLDEFQNTMCESGKKFGSMNMDEFINSIWTAEENQNQAHHPQNDAVANTLAIVNPPAPAGRGILGLAKQPSLALPAPLCRKTVEEVWSEIHGGGGTSRSGQNPSAQQRQQTFGEMTLEDFLIKAGVVRDAGLAPPPPPPPPPVMYQNGSNPHTYGPTAMTVPGGFPALPQNESSASAYVTPGPGSSKRNNGYVPAGTVCYGGAGGGYGAGLGMASPVSPLGPEGRKRTVDGPVVERRQRRMIKNRESAARSRARKQAYTVELEAELNQLREENRQLKQALDDQLERQRNQQQYVEEQKKNVPQNRAEDRIQRSKSCPL